MLFALYSISLLHSNTVYLSPPARTRTHVQYFRSMQNHAGLGSARARETCLFQPSIRMWALVLPRPQPTIYAFRIVSWVSSRVWMRKLSKRYGAGYGTEEEVWEGCNVVECSIAFDAVLGLMDDLSRMQILVWATVLKRS